MHDAIDALADLPTARLERLLAEHIDLCSYRLDAWITALYAQRLAAMRGDRSAQGLHLGAFGWVENLRPDGDAPARRADACPPRCAAPPARTVFRGQRQRRLRPRAVAAAGGHRGGAAQRATCRTRDPPSHDRSRQPVVGARARGASRSCEGVRNGQPIAALLGYQLERGLHERHPGVELDQYIYVLRDRFPLLSGRLTEIPPGTSAEAIEARNVVDGLDLVEATGGKTYPYGIAGLPARRNAAKRPPSPPRSTARTMRSTPCPTCCWPRACIRRCREISTRTQASLQALTEPEAPPEPEVVRTPRSGRVLTFRVAARARRRRDGRMVHRAVAARARQPAAQPLARRIISRRRPPSSGRCATARRAGACSRSPTSASSRSTSC